MPTAEHDLRPCDCGAATDGRYADVHEAACLSLRTGPLRPDEVETALDRAFAQIDAEFDGKLVPRPRVRLPRNEATHTFARPAAPTKAGRIAERLYRRLRSVRCGHCIVRKDGYLITIITRSRVIDASGGELAQKIAPLDDGRADPHWRAFFQRMHATELRMAATYRRLLDYEAARRAVDRARMFRMKQNPQSAAASARCPGSRMSRAGAVAVAAE